jgi:hypothetical protein
MMQWWRDLTSWWRVRRIRRRLEMLGYVEAHKTSRHDRRH